MPLRRSAAQPQPTPTPPLQIAWYERFHAQVLGLTVDQMMALTSSRERFWTGSARRSKERIANLIADLAYDTGRVQQVSDDEDVVVGAEPPLANVAMLQRPPGAFDVALAILVHDLISPAEFAAVTGWWTAVVPLDLSDVAPVEPIEPVAPPPEPAEAPEPEPVGASRPVNGEPIRTRRRAAGLVVSGEEHTVHIPPPPASPAAEPRIVPVPRQRTRPAVQRQPARRRRLRHPLRLYRVVLVVAMMAFVFGIPFALGLGQPVLAMVLLVAVAAGAYAWNVLNARIAARRHAAWVMSQRRALYRAGKS